MPLGDYGFRRLFAWVGDRFGVSLAAKSRMTAWRGHIRLLRVSEPRA
jgi:hypothetical protein